MDATALESEAASNEAPSSSAAWMACMTASARVATPTASSRQQVRRGSYATVADLIAAIQRYIDGYNQRANPFVWTKTPEQVLAKAINPQATSETEH